MIVHFHIFEPHNAIFKGNKNDKAKVFTVNCYNSENCGLYKRGECSLRAFSGGRCAYGNAKNYYGFTRRASKYYSWNEEQRDKYKDIGSLGSPSESMTIVGDYVFLPYPYMNMNKSVPFTTHGGLFSNGSGFIKLEDFTIENINKIIYYRPQAMMGGTIDDYQKDCIPKFLKHLSEQMPELFNSLCDTNEYVKEKVKEFTNIGRKAVLESLTPNMGVLIDIHGSSWIWDGYYLTSENSRASFMLVNKFTELRIRPIPGQIVSITDEKQVNKNTKFIG